MTLQLLDSLCEHLDKEIAAHYLYLTEESARELMSIVEDGDGVYFAQPLTENYDDHSLFRYRGFVFLIPTVQ